MKNIEQLMKNTHFDCENDKGRNLRLRNIFIKYLNISNIMDITDHSFITYMSDNKGELSVIFNKLPNDKEISLIKFLWEVEANELGNNININWNE